MLNLELSNKDILAKLMATENITVLHKKVPTAYFDVKSRTLVCPILKDNMSSELYDLFMGHEVGHARNTPTEGWHDAVCEKGGLFKGYLNVIEDCRIEDKIKAKYPGLRRSFYKGYEELASDDFFGIKGKDLSKLNLIDKINIHFKIGAQARVQFSNEERPYIIRCKNLKTFDEVKKLATELFERQEERTDEEMKSMTQDELEALMEMFDIDSSEEGEESSGNTITVQVEENEEGEEGSSDGKGNNEEKDDNEKDGESNSGDGESESESDKQSKPENGGQKGGKSPEERLADELNKSETDESFRENEGRLFKEDHLSRDPSHFELTNKIKYENFTVKWKEIDELINHKQKDRYRSVLNRAPVQAYVKRFIDGNKKIVANMVKEFEMKKAAADYKRSYSAKTGELNMDRLHLYRLKDDIFNRVQVTPDGKNHGVVMVIDWSGSMTGSVRSTVEQASLLSMFCRRLQIPFRLFAFSDNYSRMPESCESRSTWQGERVYGKNKVANDKMEKWDLGNLALLEIFNEKMSNAEFIRSMENWFQLAAGSDYTYAYENEHEPSYDHNWYAPSKLNLGGTPLDATIMVMRDYLIDFKRNYGLDICSFIALTDGESHECFNQGNSYLVDRRINKVFPLATSDRYYGSKTKKLLGWLKETADVRTIGFYLTKTSGSGFFRNVENFCGTKLNGYDDYSLNKRKEFNKLSVSFTDGAYDLSIVINQKKISIDYKADELDYVLGGQTMETGVTKGKLKNALVKAGNNKMKQRVILNQFVEQMAV
jgi:hypothetical protein